MKLRKRKPNEQNTCITCPNKYMKIHKPVPQVNFAVYFCCETKRPIVDTDTGK